MTTLEDRPGLQGERTALAWSRTALAALAVACVAVKAALNSHDIAVMLAGALATLAAAILGIRARARATFCPTAGRPVFAIRLVAATLLAAAIAVAFSILPDLFTS